MGTNYYLDTGKAFLDTYKRRHIGKSSGGWCFALHVIPEDGINDLDDWRALWASGVIRSEYGDKLSPKEMEEVITQRARQGFDWDSYQWLSYRSEADFHATNHSERGPNGLLRHAIGDYCIGHGSGTWDYIPGRFS